MNLMTAPSRKTPISTSSTPAISVATIRPASPYCWMMPYMMTMNAPVGPPICTRLPPSSETTSPARMAVTMPFSGDTPEAMPNAIASGSATMPTMMPAIRSEANVRFE